jgi:plastocyanin
MTGISRGRLVFAIVTAALVVGVGAAPASASGGGGCGAVVTDAAVARITISSFCFGPTVARVQPGDVVTFRNGDPFPHTVLGANGVWGSFGRIEQRESVTYRFDRPGVYPYVCTFHPGMVGVIVVGSGDGLGAAGLMMTAAGPVTRVFAQPQDGSPSPNEEPLTVRASASVPSSPGPWPAIAIASLVALALLTAALLRERRRRT